MSIFRVIIIPRTNWIIFIEKRLLGKILSFMCAIEMSRKQFDNILK